MATVEQQVSRGLERHEDLQASPALPSGAGPRFHCAENAPRFAISVNEGLTFANFDSRIIRAESREQRAESREQRAESREQRAESREQRAESRERHPF